MLKAVLTAIPSYTMACFQLPLSLCKRIQSAYTRFWWDTNAGQKRMCWVAWNLLAKPKKFGGLGFREVQDFNEALLGKLSWRLLNNPHCLLSRVLMGKYCHSTDFMHVSPAKNASHGWHSILVGRDLIAPHVTKAIGTGNTISVWRDQWLNTIESKTPMGPPTAASADWKVSDLLDQSGSWNEQRVKEVLPDYASEILSLRASKSGAEDSLNWIHSNSGIYTSKSGYYTKVMLRQEPSHPNHNQPSLNWIKDLWSQAYSPKLKIFIWKIIQHALPLGANLASRGLLQGSRCARCNDLETAKHLLFECTFAKSVWDQAPLQVNGSFIDATTFEEALLKGTKAVALPPTGAGPGPLFPWLCWTIWTARNRLVFQGKPLTTEECITKAIREANEWNRAQELQQQNRALSLPSYSRPMVNMNYPSLYIDASWLPQNKETGIGWLICNQSSILAQGMDKMSFINSPIMAEALAMEKGLQEALNRQIVKLQVFSDSQTLIRMMNEKELHRSIYGILADLKSLSKKFLDIDFYWIPRSQNGKADSLARTALLISPLNVVVEH